MCVRAYSCRYLTREVVVARAVWQAPNVSNDPPNRTDTSEPQGKMSRTSRDRLLSAAAGAAVTLAALWLALITAAVVTVILRA